MKYKVIKKQKNSKKCFICGIENRSGLQSDFYELDSNEVAAVFTASEDHEGHPGILHGGIISAILDETMGRAILVNWPNTPAYTVELNIQFLKTIPSGVKLKAIARIKKHEGRVFEGMGEIFLEGGEIAATAYGKYLAIPPHRVHESSSYSSGEDGLGPDDLREFEI